MLLQLIFKMSPIFRDTTLQTLGEAIDDGRKLFDSNLSPSFLQSAFQRIYPAVSCSARFVLQDGPHQEVYGIQIGEFGGQTFLSRTSEKSSLQSEIVIFAPCAGAHLVEASTADFRNGAGPTGPGRLAGCIVGRWRH